MTAISSIIAILTIGIGLAMDVENARQLDAPLAAEFSNEAFQASWLLKLEGF